jgi:hypothetical protein
MKSCPFPVLLIVTLCGTGMREKPDADRFIGTEVGRQLASGFLHEQRLMRRRQKRSGLSLGYRQELTLPIWSAVQA